MTRQTEQLINELWREHSKTLRFTVKRNLRNDSDAEDIVVEAFLGLAEALEQGPVDKPLHLLRKIVSRRVTDELRAIYRRPEPAGLIEDRDGGDTVAPLWGPALPEHRFATFADDFDSGVRELEDEDRDAFILTELRGMTLREAAPVLGVSYETVRARADRARARIQERVDV